MTFPRNLPRSIVAAVVVNFTMIAQALAAPSFALPFNLSSMSTRDLLLYGSIALLVIGLIAKVIRDRQHSDVVPEGPDLRWWKNPPPAPQP